MPIGVLLRTGRPWLLALLSIAILYFLAGGSLGENEINNNASAANPIASQGKYSGHVSPFDKDDYYSIAVPANSVLSVFVELINGSGGFDLNYSQGPGSWRQLRLGSLGEIPAYSIRLYLTSSETIIFGVANARGEFDYNITTARTALGVWHEEIPSLEELSANDAFGLSFYPARENAPLAPGSGYRHGANLANGGTTLYGWSMCARLEINNDLPRIRVHRGLILDPVEAGLQRMITSRTINITVPANSVGCFRALSHNISGSLGSIHNRYFLSGSLDGNAAMVMSEIDKSGRDEGAGELAMWAVTSGVTNAQAREWGADGPMIAEAVDILSDAHVQTALVADTDYLLPCLAGGVIAIVALGVLSKRRAARDRAINVDAFGMPPVPGASGKPVEGPSGATPPAITPSLAVISCPACNREVTLPAPACPHCGQGLLSRPT